MNVELILKFREKFLPAHVLISAIEGNFDVWRNNYDYLSITDLIWINNGLHHFVGSQTHYNFNAIKTLLDMILTVIPSLTILELGCWKGNLAKELLSKYKNVDIKEYFGYDINYSAIDESVVDDCRYTAIKMTDWFHKYSFGGDVLISCHTLEHMSEVNIRKMMDAVNMSSLRYLIFEVPFNHNRKWNGGNNSHILDLNSEDFVHIMKACGFRLFSIIDTTRPTRENIYNQWVFGLERIK